MLSCSQLGHEFFPFHRPTDSFAFHGIIVEDSSEQRVHTNRDISTVRSFHAVSCITRSSIVRKRAITA